MKYHPMAEAYPMMSDDEFNGLVEDIKKNGLKIPIVVYEDKILDGRNRFKACEKVRVTPKFEDFKGDSAVSFIVSMNSHRRHLTASQKATVASELEPFFAAEAKKRQGQRTDLKPNIVELIPQSKLKSRDQAAKAVGGVSGKYVSDVRAIQKKAPVEYARIKEGHATITEVKRKLQREEVRKSTPLPSDKYRIVYADPPWKYGDQLTENYGATEYHYPSMSILELCALPVSELCEDNAVLFLWVTSPLLEECFPVIKAWGFRYKTSFVWDKVKHNMGHYNSVRHEFLLICTKGSCLPDNPKLIDSVVSIERSDKHSEKPEEFRKIIDSLYTEGKRIELFSRSKAKGWDVWGNQMTV